VIGFNVIELLHAEMDRHIISCRLINLSRIVLLLQSGFRKEGKKHAVVKFILISMYIWYTSSREHALAVSVLATR
jgi:hypothetical protein